MCVIFLYTIFELSISILECSISCLDGHTLNPTVCSCVLTDICVADNPCTNGVCELVSSPDQYTCDCTGTNYMGTNCSGIEIILKTLFFLFVMHHILFHGRM